MLRSLGGDGHCGGAGGRVVVYLESEIYYFGTYEALGGNGQDHYLSEGGPGSVYINDQRYCICVIYG